MTSTYRHVHTYTCPAIFLTPFVRELVLRKTNRAWPNPSSPLSQSLFLSLSLTLSVCLSPRVLCGAYASEYYTG